MFRPMRRIRQQLSQEECQAVLARGTSGVLALSGDEGYPYALPISYVYHDGKLYFHCAKSGHKLDAIRRDSKVSFCVIDQDQIVPQEYTTYFRSVIAFGRMRILEDDGEKRAAIEALSLKYAPEEPREHLPGRFLLIYRWKRMSRSTLPWMPGTRPVEEYCHISKS